MNTPKNKTNSPFQVKKYTASHKAEWNNFIASAKNATFLFNRNFMEYHSDRFEDFSLMVYKGNKLISVLPAHKEEKAVFSHNGLSYGGLVLNKKIKLKEVVSVVKTILEFLETEQIQTLHLKVLPSMYHKLPSEEIKYLLNTLHAKPIAVEASTVIDYKAPLKIQSNRLEGVKKAEKLNLTIRENKDFSSFWENILEPHLKERYHTNPVHSLSEIESLASNFPKNIHQFNVFLNATIVAGTTIFETQQVARVQYIAANQDKQQLGSLDFLFHHLITERFKKKNYFDFGTSSVDSGTKINDGLQYWKESFGGRTLVYEQYQINVANNNALDDLFI